MYIAVLYMKPNINPLNATIMKKNKIALVTVPFIIGTIFGIAVFTVLSFVKDDAPADPPQQVSPISAADANALVKRYLSSAVPLNTPVRGYYINLQQLDAMNRLAIVYPSLAGFRIYIGKASDDSQVGIIVGVDNKGIDAVANGIYSTNSPQPGPCPPFCDSSSPIIK
jgi:hypothetical protein